MKKNLLGSRSFLYDNEFVFLSEFHDDIVHNEQFYVLNCQRSTRISGVFQHVYLLRDVSTEASGTTAVAPKYSDISFKPIPTRGHYDWFLLWDPTKKDSEHCIFIKQARLWACGRGDLSTPSFGSHLNPIPYRGGEDRSCPPYTLMSKLSFANFMHTCYISWS